MLTFELIPILSDNYVFLIYDSLSSEAFVVDPGEAFPVIEAIKNRKLRLSGILITHHHGDHINGIEKLKNEFQAKVFAPKKNRLQIPLVDHWVQEGDLIEQGLFKMKVIELPGHTLGHLAYYFEKEKWLFSGDVVFGLGCGRLFEGTFAQMYSSLQRIKILPPETKIFCTHEYTENNLRFCQSLLGDRSSVSELIDKEDLGKYELQLLSKRSQKKPSVPLRLSIEMKTNPFLLAASVEQFAEVRLQRNVFN